MRIFRISHSASKAIRNHLKEGRKIPAIKAFREETDSSLRDAKEACEWIHDLMVARGEIPNHASHWRHKNHADIKVIGLYSVESVTVDINKIDRCKIKFGNIATIEVSQGEESNEFTPEDFKTLAMMSIKDQDEKSFKMLMKLCSFIKAWNDGTLLDVITE